MFQLHDCIVFTSSIPELGVLEGTKACVIHIWGDHLGYEVETFTDEGNSDEIITLNPDYFQYLSMR